MPKASRLIPYEGILWEMRTSIAGIKQSQVPDKDGHMSLIYHHKNPASVTVFMLAYIGKALVRVRMVVGHRGGISPVPSHWALSPKGPGQWIFKLFWNNGKRSTLGRLCLYAEPGQVDGEVPHIWQELHTKLCRRGNVECFPVAKLPRA